MLTFALPKGRIFDEIVPLLSAAGIGVAEDADRTRKRTGGHSRPGRQPPTGRGAGGGRRWGGRPVRPHRPRGGRLGRM